MWLLRSVDHGMTRDTQWGLGGTLRAVEDAVSALGCPPDVRAQITDAAELVSCERRSPPGRSRSRSAMQTQNPQLWKECASASEAVHVASCVQVKLLAFLLRPTDGGRAAVEALLWDTRSLACRGVSSLAADVAAFAPLRELRRLREQRAQPVGDEAGDSDAQRRRRSGFTQSKSGNRG